MSVSERATVGDTRHPVDSWAEPRRPVQIDGLVLRIDGRALEAYSRHIDDVLVAFIELVRSARANGIEGSMSFRRMDIDVLAADLGCAPMRVIDHLAALVGADSGHFDDMIRSYDAGASMIDSGVADISDDELD